MRRNSVRPHPRFRLEDIVLKNFLAICLLAVISLVAIAALVAFLAAFVEYGSPLYAAWLVFVPAAAIIWGCAHLIERLGPPGRS
jgi:hypothetical protein